MQRYSTRASALLATNNRCSISRDAFPAPAFVIVSLRSSAEFHPMVRSALVNAISPERVSPANCGLALVRMSWIVSRVSAAYVRLGPVGAGVHADRDVLAFLVLREIPDAMQLRELLHQVLDRLITLKEQAA